MPVADVPPDYVGRQCRLTPGEPVFPAARSRRARRAALAVGARWSLGLLAGDGPRRPAPTTRSSRAPADGSSVDHAADGDRAHVRRTPIGDRARSSGGLRRQPVHARAAARGRQPTCVTVAGRLGSRSPSRRRATSAWQRRPTPTAPPTRGELRLHGTTPAGRRPPARPGGDRSPAATTTAVERRRRAATTTLDAGRCRAGRSGSAGCCRSLGIAVLFGSLVLIVAAWPEGPEYVLAVRFLRSVWIVGLVGTLIYVVGPVRPRCKGESFGSGLNPASWFDLLRRRLAGRAAVAAPRPRGRRRLGGAAPGAGDRPDDQHARPSASRRSPS